MRRIAVTLALLAAAGSCLAGLSACAPKNGGQSATLAVTESWCPEGFEVGPQDTCFAIPEQHDKTTPILIYLHGMYAGHGSSDEWAHVHGATKRGFAVVVPRGKRGLCAWTAELKDHFCWPHEVDDPASFKHVTTEWDRVLWQVEALLDRGVHKRYVVGYSNGGSFAAYLAQHGTFTAQAYAVISAGALEPPGKPAKAAPLLLLGASDDAAQGPKVRELHEGLAKVGVGHAFCTRPGAHPLAADDIETSVRFFKAEAEGKGAAFTCEAGARSAGGPASSAPGTPPSSPQIPFAPTGL